MSGTLTVQLSKPVVSAKILGSHFKEGAVSDSQLVSGRELERQKAECLQLLGALRGVVDKLNKFYDTMFVGHKEEIAKLSVGIARKILMQEVKEGNYEIEKIVQEAIKSAPTHEDVVVHLSFEDLVQCQKLQEGEPEGLLAGVKLVGDPNIGRAECYVETSKGTVESMIEGNLELVGKALSKAE
jgi:flagellar biosynthesis/type III secretory pathway protein FliH